MKLVVLGLSLSSSWGNGHATTFRALLKAFAARGHDILFLERDVPWYRDNRDIGEPNYCRLELYHSLEELDHWRDEIRNADAVILDFTSRPFDPVEFSRMCAIAEQIVSSHEKNLHSNTKAEKD